MSVSYDDDNFDFNTLEKELKSAVAADEKYTRENDAKIRAVQQKVGSYDEFREIVMASHLKPLEKGDKIDGKFVQPWNMHADKTKNQERAQDSHVTQAATKLPQNGLEFVQEWRKLSLEKKYDFLLFVGAERLGNIFKSEISFGLLGEFLTVLQELKDGNKEIVVDILESFNRTSRFSLSVQFLSSKEKEACGKLFEKLESESASVKALRSVYGLTN